MDLPAQRVPAKLCSFSQPCPSFPERQGHSGSLLPELPAPSLPRQGMPFSEMPRASNAMLLQQRGCQMHNANVLVLSVGGFLSVKSFFHQI